MNYVTVLCPPLHWGFVGVLLGKERAFDLRSFCVPWILAKGLGYWFCLLGTVEGRQGGRKRVEKEGAAPHPGICRVP